MIRVSVGSSERALSDVSPSWLREQVEDRRNEGYPVCVRVRIESGSLNLVLATPACGGGGGGGRAPTPSEKEIFDLWNKRGLNQDDFNVGQLNAFLSQIKHI